MRLIGHPTVLLGMILIYCETFIIKAVTWVYTLTVYCCLPKLQCKRERRMVNDKSLEELTNLSLILQINQNKTTHHVKKKST